MKKLHRRESIKRLCGLFGYSSQNFYKRRCLHQARLFKEEKILLFVKRVRKEQPRIGTEKLHYLILEEYPKIKIGRDALYNLLRRRHLLVRKVNRYRPKMTNGDGQSIYPDLRKGLEIGHVNQLWCTDITYLELRSKSKHGYLTLITDEASHLIVGHELSLRMQTKDVLKAFKMASSRELNGENKTFENRLIIHSDRGSQFKSKEFINYTNELGILRSMGRSGTSHENPVAERINGILKNELLIGEKFEDLNEANKKISEAIKIYNEKRPHLSCDMLTPLQAHMQNQWPLKKRWRQRKKRTKLEVAT